MDLNKYIHEKLNERKEEHQLKKNAEKEAKKDVYKGYQEGAKTGAYAKGKALGKRKYVQRTTGRGVLGGIAGMVEGASKGLKGYDSIFGVSGSGGGGIGFFGDEAPRRQSGPPQRVTTVNPKTGKVTISEPIEKKQPIQEDQYENFWGAPESQRRGKKREKHPYDVF